jgi:molecular chaperone DnaK
VGWQAREQQAQHPERIISSIKRLLGQAYSNERIAGYLQSVPYRTAAGPKDAIRVECEGVSGDAPEICAIILRHLRLMAEEQLGLPIRRVVLTHPVTFDAGQKVALTRAAQIAGLEVVALLEEPVAAALAYGFGQGKPRNEIVAVYDLGGGTFDFTVLDMSGETYRVLAAVGDAWLGGEDFDHLLADAVANAFWRSTQIELRHRVVEWQRLLVGCEQVKCMLSKVDAALLEIPNIVVAPEPLSIRQRIDRPVFERICLPLLQSSLEICTQAFQSLGLEPRDVTQAVATGGSTCIPFVRRGLEQYFGKTTSGWVDPFYAICLGAGLYAARLAGHPARRVQPMEADAV